MKKINAYLTVSQAAEMLGVSALTLRNWDNQGKLKAKRNPINGYRIYESEELDKFLEQLQSGVENG